MISYKKLWIMLAEKEMSKTQLRDKVGMSTATLARLGKNEYVELKLLDKICNVLKCDIGDVIEVILDREEVAANDDVYPQWENINADMEAQFKVYHKELQNMGYEIKSANIAKKGDTFYWILMGSDGPYIEAYGKLVNGKAVKINPKAHPTEKIEIEP